MVDLTVPQKRTSTQLLSDRTSSLNINFKKSRKEKIKGFVILQAACDPQGKREKVQTENKAIIQKIKDAGVKVPIILGYGIRDSERVKEAVGMGADGALVGTAMIEQITTGNYKAFADFIRSLKDATR